MIGRLGSVPLFQGLTPQHLADLEGISATQRFHRGQPVFSEGDEAQGFYVVRNGRVKVFKLSSEGKEQILHILGPGEPFGEVAMFAGKHFPASAEAMERTELFFFPRESFVALITQEPSLALNMLAVLSLRLRQFANLVENLSLKEVPGRLAAYLLYLSGRKGNSNELELDIAKGQLASVLGTIPETLSRILAKMMSEGLIQVQGPLIRILDRDSLMNLAEEGKFPAWRQAGSER